ncbi:MAG: hypothetical protein R3F54_05100 [Alphaproteobacteria bacterium]
MIGSHERDPCREEDGAGARLDTPQATTSGIDSSLTVPMSQIQEENKIKTLLAGIFTFRDK